VLSLVRITNACDYEPAQKMNTPNAQQVSKLRALTGASLNQCITALKQTQSFEDSVIAVKKIQQESGVKLGAEVGTQSKVFSYIHHNGTVGALVKITAKTDFVLNTDKVSELANSILLTISFAKPSSIEDAVTLSQLKTPDVTIKQSLEQLSAILKEPISLTDFKVLAS
jgi:translation elongation factor EF-Ts